MSKKVIKVIHVCKENECDNVAIMDVEVGKIKHNFCCIKGLEKALAEFQQYLKTGKSVQNN